MGTDDAVSRFLQVSAAYLFGAAYCANLRAAFARNAARDPVSEHALRYRELIACEAAGLMQAQLEEERQRYAASVKRLPQEALADCATP
jgi:hypothetical protein